ncbi:MAG UNVERIFIED_CONTAM: BolA family transcriptional regulator [Rickettsiaceae bacterium]|jgi:BolA protein
MLNRCDNIRKILLEALKPQHLEIIDESYKHIGHITNKGGEFTHLKIIISDDFSTLSLVQKHRIIKNLLKSEFENGLHALAIEIIA